MLASVVVSFIAITMVASYYRFQHIVQQAESSQPDEMGASADDILRVQLARYLAGCARRGTSFAVSLIHTDNPAVEVRIGASFVEAIKLAARCGDVVCIFDGRTAALLTEAEPEDTAGILRRILGSAESASPELEQGSLRAGIASYPGHGLSGRELLQVAQNGLGQTDEASPVVMPEIVDFDDEDEEGAEESVAAVVESALAEEVAEGESGPKVSKGWKERRKNVMLDELTGVLKPSAVSAYMQRMMSEMRRKKQHVALFCIGVNNIEHIIRIHGEDAANDVLVGISKIMQENLRADDLIGRHEKYAFLVLAQASLSEAEIVGKRISTLVQQSEFVAGAKRLKTTITLGVATYPEHGRNLHQLYTAGQKVLDYSRANDIRAYAVYDPQLHDKVESKPMKNIKSVQA
ncbi:sensor domain-containing diguanylate cyclase [Pontiella sulfatireligans]|uniref:sensor domain-containing diguanylate cyclase n=1 Tax=Pontiella sulfatireligans TaxID=2750658 RepID=UPI001444529C|nr:diguanylate cyclase [Pontiella sulfatireligans]